jgi:hypothetical protein
MRIFLNNIIIDTMDYLEFSIDNEEKENRQGSTSEEMAIDIRLDDGQASR